MAGIDNLTPWTKGTSGNPKGKPPGARNRTTINREIADMLLSDLGISLEHLPSDMDVAKAASIQLWRKGILESDTTAIRDALDNAFGKNADVLIDQSGPRKMVMVVTQSDIDDPPTE